MSCKYRLAHFLALSLSHKVSSKPSFVEISFYVCVYTLTYLQSCSIVFTSFPHWCSNFLLHCVMLPWGTFLKFCEICAESVCVHAGMHVCASINPVAEYCVCLWICAECSKCAFLRSKVYVQEASAINLTWLYCRLAGVIIVTAFSTFISFDIDSNLWLDARIW